MTQHRRMPALLAMLLSAGLGMGILAATGQFRGTDLAHASLQEIEKKAVGCTDGRVWSAYGDKLREAGRFSSAAKAYRRALEYQPELADARLAEGIALAQAKEADSFFDYVTQLAMSYPRQAADLMDRAETQPMHADARWEPTSALVQAQSVD